MRNFFLLMLTCFLLPLNCTSQQASNQKRTTTRPQKTTNTQNTPRPTTTATPSVQKVDPSDFRASMLAAVNKLRANGCRCGGRTMPPVPPLRWNSQLEAAAIRHATDMSSNGHFDHIGTDNSAFDDRITASGYKWMEIGENIAFGYEAISTTMKGWLDSESHCKQMMSAKVDEMGAAKSGKYWVQEFGRQRNW
ncbi:MAG: CAP domain-containing protein [Saprospiraceae bacterium]|nr:CAP domain-containing protein [Saprospiraceae bacterium]